MVDTAMSVLDRGSDWKLTATAVAAVVTVTQPAPPIGQVNYVTGISASYGSAAVAASLLATLKDGGVTIGNFFINDDVPMTREYVSPIRCHGAVELQLGAGPAGATGAVTLDGFTR